MISKKSKNWMHRSYIFEQQAILLLCFRCTFSTTLHGSHTYRDFDLQLLTYLSTSEKAFLTHPIPNSLLIPFMHAVWPVSMVFSENKSWNFGPGYFSLRKLFKLECISWYIYWEIQLSNWLLHTQISFASDIYWLLIHSIVIKRCAIVSKIIARPKT